MLARTGQATRRSASPNSSKAAAPTALRAATAHKGVMYCSNSLLTTQVKPQASTTTASSASAWRRESEFLLIFCGAARRVADKPRL